MEILKVENLCKVYGKGNNQVQALNNVSFSVEKGEFVAKDPRMDRGLIAFTTILGAGIAIVLCSAFFPVLQDYTNSSELYAKGCVL